MHSAQHVLVSYGNKLLVDKPIKNYAYVAYGATNITAYNLQIYRHITGVKFVRILN